MSHLVIRDGGGERTFSLEGSVVVVGRGNDCDLVLDDDAASVEHCELQLEDGEWRVVDLESRHGTRVNGRYVNQHVLSNGDALELGGSRLVFRGGAAPSPLARKPSRRAQAAAAAPAPARGRRASPKPAPRSRRRERSDIDDEERPARESRRESRRARRKGADTMTIVLITIPALVVVGFLGYLIIKPKQSTNRRVANAMLAAKANLDWQAVIDASAQADPNGDAEWERIQGLKAEAEEALKGYAEAARIEEARRAYDRVVVWAQRNKGETGEHVRRIDEFLAQYGDMAVVAVQEAKRVRTQLTGSSSATAPRGADEAWDKLNEEIELLIQDGYFGKALLAVDAFWEENRVKKPALSRDVQVLKAELAKKAQRWFAIQVTKARKWRDHGSPARGRMILEKAAENIGIQRYVDLAEKHIRELGH